MAKNGKKLSRGAGCLIVVVVIVAVMACLVVIANTTAPRDNAGETSQPDGAAVSSEEQSETVPDPEVVSEPESEAQNQVLFDSDTMKVTYLGIEETPGIEGAYLNLEVENKTATRAMLLTAADTSTVNGYNILMMQGVPTYINAGGKGLASIILSYQQFGAQSVDDIESVYMDLQLVNADSISDVLATAPISMTF